MNRYEAHIKSKVTRPTTTRHLLDKYRDRHNYPIYTADEAIVMAARLPGLMFSVSARIEWIRLHASSTIPGYFESLPDGLRWHPYVGGIDYE